MRLGLGLLFAIFVNLGLFTIMQAMTSSNNLDRNRTEEIRLLDFVRVKKDTTTETKKRELPDKPKPPEKMPPPPSMTPPTKQVKAPRPKIAVPNIKVPLNIAGGPYIGAFSAASVTPVTAPVSDYAQVAPLVRVPPRYPRSAVRRNIEGVVKVAFTITADGRVSNPRVLSASPPGVFDKAAIKAIKKWKFNPKIVDGQAVEQSAAQEVTFKLAK
jgi:protein TonB